MPNPTSDNTFDLVSLTARMAPGGLTLNIKSQVFEDFFRAQFPAPETRRDRDLYGGAQYYHTQTSFGDFTSGDINSWGGRELLQNGRPNIAVLRAVGLGNGVSITIPTVLHKKQQAEYLKAFEYAALDFYGQYIRAEPYELKITVEHVTEAPISNART